MSFKALIFDVDGTLAETEEAHRKAFNKAFAEAGLEWKWSRERYRELLAVSGGKERILRFIRDEAQPYLQKDGLEAWIAGLHKEKTRIYAEMMAAGEVGLRPGVERLINEAREAGIRLAIATTTTNANIDALFDATLGLDALKWFDVIGAAAQAPVKKPDPSVYLWVLDALSLSPEECIAIEDTRNGVLAARGADIPVVVTQSFYSAGEDFSGALAVVSDLGEPEAPFEPLGGAATEPGWVTPARLAQWLEQAQTKG